MTFGQKLREMREKAEIGVRQMARDAGLSLSHYQYLEKDEFSPTPETLSKIAGVLKIPPAKLTKLKDDLQTETDLTILLREAGDLSADERARLLQVAKEILGPPRPRRRRSSRV